MHLAPEEKCKKTVHSQLPDSENCTQRHSTAADTFVMYKIITSVTF